MPVSGLLLSRRRIYFVQVNPISVSQMNMSRITVFIEDRPTNHNSNGFPVFYQKQFAPVVARIAMVALIAMAARLMIALTARCVDIANNSMLKSRSGFPGKT